MLVLILVQLAGCQSPSSQYLMNGIGAELPAPDIKRAATLQNAYFNYLCQQAGLVDDPFSSTPGKCMVQAMDAGGWNLIVRQGMNDIDRRCDAYLEWLDNKQRSAGPLRNQLRDLQGAVQGIMFAVDPGSVAALEIVGLAFGLIDRSLQNYNSRLLLLVEPSTRNSVVLNALRDFRRQVRRDNLQFSTRPDAEYALREYMRRCLPFAIEAQINDLSTLGSQGVSPRDATTIFEAPVAMGLLRDTPGRATDTIVRTRDNVRDVSSGPGSNDNPIITADLGGITKIEKSFKIGDVERLQRNLCVPVTGSFDNATRTAIAKMQDGRNTAQTRQIASRRLKDVALGEPLGCDGYLDAFEKFHFRSDTNDPAAKVKRFKSSLKNCADNLVTASNGALTPPPSLASISADEMLDAGTREVIKFALSNVVGTGDMDPSGALTKVNIEAITTCSPVSPGP